MVILPGQTVAHAQLRQKQFAQRTHLCGRFGGIGAEVLQHQHELVATEPRHRVLLAQTGAQALRHFHQQQVAHLVAPAVVQGLEVVDVHEQHGRIQARARAAGHDLLQPVYQQPPVGQAGEGIVEGEVAGFFLGGLAGGDVDVDAEHLGGLPRYRNVACGWRTHRRASHPCAAGCSSPAGMASPVANMWATSLRTVSRISGGMIRSSRLRPMCFLGGVAVQRFGRLVPVAGGAVGAGSPAPRWTECSRNSERKRSSDSRSALSASLRSVMSRARSTTVAWPLTRARPAAAVRPSNWRRPSTGCCISYSTLWVWPLRRVCGSVPGSGRPGRQAAHRAAACPAARGRWRPGRTRSVDSTSTGSGPGVEHQQHVGDGL
jgi:hypothetical protein